MMGKHEERLAGYAHAVNEALRAFVRVPEDCAQGHVIEAMAYSLLDAGKRVRAALVLEFGRLSGASEAGAMQLACAVEMIHAYSLIHDDLPCMDDDDLRRGKPSCHKKFGEATALLAGDGLLTLAFETVAGAPLPAERRVDAAARLARAAGALGMVGGQVIDLASEGSEIGWDQLDRLYALKTGALLRVSAELGCVAGGADEQMLEYAEDYARAFGLAFQITDDLLDVAGDPDKLGKPIGSDADNHKNTYVTLLGAERARQEAEALIGEAKQAVSTLDDPSFLIWLADLVLRRES